MLNFCPHCGKPWSQTKFCAHCGANLSKFIEDDTPVNYFNIIPDPAPADTSVDGLDFPTPSADEHPADFDFEKLAAEAAKTALAIQLEPFEVEESGNGKYIITALKKKNASTLTVPDCVDVIAAGAFEGCKAYEISLPEGLIRIDERAFANAKLLEILNIPSTVKDIGDEAFAGCERLDITIPEDVWQGRDVMKNTLTAKKAEEERRKAARKAFEAESDVENGVLRIYRGNKTEVDIPDGIVAIGKNAFSTFSTKTIRSITIPNSVTSIGWGAFLGCSNLTNITIPNSVTSIGDYAFVNCSNLTNITIPSSVTRIGKVAFNGCSNLTNIKIPNSVTSIGGEAFRYCSNLKYITLPRRFESQLSHIYIDPARTRVAYI